MLQNEVYERLRICSSQCLGLYNIEKKVRDCMCRYFNQVQFLILSHNLFSSDTL